MSQLKEILRSVLFNEHGHIEVYNLADNCINWPSAIKPDDYEGEWYDEEQDLENYDILSISDDEIVISCGGDWQEPMTITIVSMDGVLFVTNVIADEGANFGLDEQEIKSILKII